MQAQSADGVIHDFPDGTNMSVIDNVMKSYAATSPQKADASPAPTAPDMSAQSEFPTYAAPVSGDAAPDNAAHSFGVGVRNVAEGLAGSLPGQAVDALTWPGRAVLRAAGAHVTAPSDMVSEGLTEAGVPEAETPGEKLRGSAISGAASMLPTMGLGSIAALAEKSPALAKAFADGIIGQLTGGAASGVASEGTRQLGGGPVAQTVAGMAGGLVGGVAGTRVSGSEATATPKMYGEAFAPDVSQLDSRNAIQALIQHDINENPVIPGRAPDFGAANQGAEAIAAIGAAPDIDTAIAAASKAAQSPVERPMAQWMQPISAARDESVAGIADDIMNPPYSQPVANDTNATPLQSVGAAASRDSTPQTQIALSPTDVKANRYQAEMGEILSSPTPGDKTVYVPGSLPTLAEYSGDPELSQQENLLRQRRPDAFFSMDPGKEGRMVTNNNARVAEFDNQTPSRTALTMMRDQRNAQWETDSKGILPTAKPVDFMPAMDWVEGQLNNPKIQENDAVRGVLQDFRERLLADDGILKDDPSAAWGIHDNIQNQLAKAKDPLNATGAEKFAFNELTQAKAHVDAALNVATDNKFQNAVNNYAQASQAINAGEELEAFRPKLTNPGGAIMADRFHKFVVDLAQRRGDPGIDPAMNISDDTMRSLINIDNDLKRAGLIKLGAAAGSPTNLYGALAEKVGIGAAHKLLGKVPFAGPVLEGTADYFGQKRLDALTAKHLAEPEGGYTFPEGTNRGVPTDAAAQNAQNRMGIGFSQ